MDTMKQYQHAPVKITAAQTKNTRAEPDSPDRQQQLQALIEAQDRRLRRLESELVELRSWIARNTR